MTKYAYRVQKMPVHYYLIIIISLLINSCAPAYISATSENKSHSVTDYLKSEPLSMLEWGIIKLRRSIYESEMIYTTLSKFGCCKNIAKKNLYNVKYNKGSNTISIHLKIYPKQRYFKRSSSKLLCKNIINEVRLHLGIIRNKPPLVQQVAKKTRGIGTYFSHFGFSNPKKPGDLNKKLEDITLIMASFRIGKNNKPPFRLARMCIGKLDSKKIFFVDVKKHRSADVILDYFIENYKLE